MKVHSRVLISLLSAAIRNQEPGSISHEEVDWYTLYDEASAHQVHPLLYPVIRKLDKNMAPDQSLITLWHRETMGQAARLLASMEIFNKILHSADKDNIPVILLKGLVLRDYYPNPGLRTMGDADLLVHREDLNRFRKILCSFGYRECEATVKHLGFYHPEYLRIEVHWILSNKEVEEQIAFFSDEVWENAVRAKGYGENILILSPQDQFLHLILHTVNHIEASGFGLRQLCDLTLFVEASVSSLSWDNIFSRAEHFGLSHYTYAVLEICNRLFDCKFPGLQNFALQGDEDYVQLFIEDIIHSGVYGNRSIERNASTSILKILKLSNYSESHSLFLFWIKILFPPASGLGQRYAYVKKHPIMLPAAWIHRIIRNFGRREFIKQAGDIRSLSRTRSKLLHWLLLQ